MGKTNHKHHNNFDDEDRNKKNSKGSKHSRNVPGQGMRVINSWYADDDEDYFDDDIEMGDSIDIVHTKNTR